jgi:Lrp/AsnC family transcriptional regulator, regulator of ectoine-degradation genes
MKDRLRLDDRDLKILAILQKEGRISKTALAERVNLSATPCWERLRRLEEAGIITGYGARLDPTLFGPRTVVFVQAEIETHRASDFARFEAAMHASPEVLECWAVGGGFDYILKVGAADIDAYQRFMDGLLTANVGLKRYFSFLVTKPIKRVEALVDPEEGLSLSGRQ